MRQHTATVSGGAEVTPGAHLLILDCPSLSAGARPGQFVMVRCGEGYDPYLRQAVPIHRLTEQGLALYFRPSNRGLAWLGARRVGDAIDLLGPGGRGFDLPPGLGSASLIAQGMGIAPLLSILDRLTCPVQLVVAAPTNAQLYPRELLSREVEFIPHAGHGRSQDLQESIRQTCRWGERIYAAGSLGLYRQVRQAIETTRLGLRRGLAEVWIETEMACGQGLCGACLLETRTGSRQVCLDGPAFDLADLVLEEKERR